MVEEGGDGYELWPQDHLQRMGSLFHPPNFPLVEFPGRRQAPRVCPMCVEKQVHAAQGVHCGRHRAALPASLLREASRIEVSLQPQRLGPHSRSASVFELSPASVSVTMA